MGRAMGELYREKPERHKETKMEKSKLGRESTRVRQREEKTINKPMIITHKTAKQITPCARSSKVRASQQRRYIATPVVIKVIQPRDRERENDRKRVRQAERQTRSERESGLAAFCPSAWLPPL